MERGSYRSEKSGCWCHWERRIKRKQLLNTHLLLSLINAGCAMAAWFYILSRGMNHAAYFLTEPSILSWKQSNPEIGTISSCSHSRIWCTAIQEAGHWLGLSWCKYMTQLPTWGSGRKLNPTHSMAEKLRLCWRNISHLPKYNPTPFIFSSPSFHLSFFTSTCTSLELFTLWTSIHMHDP